MATLAGTVTGANSRDVIIGSAPLTPPDFVNSGKLVSTPVTQGGTTMFTVEVKSNDNQTIAHTNLTVTVASSPAGLSIADFYDPDPNGTDASFCGVNGNTISCDYGNLAGFAERTIAVVVNVSADFPTNATGLFSAVATTNNENGSNLQSFPADSGGFAVQAASANGLQTFVPPGQLKQLNTAGLNTAGAGKLSTAIKFAASAQGDAVAINEGTDPVGKYACPSGLTCQPDYSEVAFTHSGFGAPYLTWTLTALVPSTYTLSKAFIVHYTSATASDPVMFVKDKTAWCGSDLDATMAAKHQCINVATLSKPDKATGLSTLVLQAIFDHNGGARF
jgi:hypothetical protein